MVRAHRRPGEDAWGRHDRWFVPIADPGQVGEGAEAALPRPKKVALVKQVSKHAGWSGDTPCCLDFLLSEQPDFQAQQNAIQELNLSRGHYCIFLPKYHPELSFIEHYWSLVKCYQRWPQDRD